MADSAYIPRVGALVAWWRTGSLALGVVAGEEKQRLRLVLSRGREARVPRTRVLCEVEFPGAVPGPGLEDRKLAGERVDRAAERLRAASSRVDVPLVWEIVVEGREGDALDAEELAGLALDSTSGESRAGVSQAFLDDGVHFVRRGDSWVPRSPAAVGELQAERRRIDQRTRQSEAFLDAIRPAARAAERFSPTGTEAERRYLDALLTLAVEQELPAGPVREQALTALSASGLRHDRPHEGAFRLLREIGPFESDDENLQVLRYGLRTEFPPEVLEQAEAAARRGFVREGRRDLTGLTAVSIDGPRTREIDDALSVVAEAGGGYQLGVHIADPSVAVAPGDALDREAARRALTHYMPDLRLPMLPKAVSEEAFSLIEGHDRPALSFLIELDPRGEISGWEVTRSLIHSRARLDYRQADRTIARAEGPFHALLRELDDLAGLRERARAREGAVLLRAPDVDLYLGPDGEPELERVESDSASRRIVSEAMVLAGAVAAMFTRKFDLPAIYRRQGEPETPFDDTFRAIADPAAVRRTRLSLRRAEVGLEPGPHHSLGLAAYTQVTSPIRRYQDLVMHRQIVSALEVGTPCYGPGELQRIVAGTEQAGADARRAERAADAYWTLRYLERRVGEEVCGRVLQLEPRPLVQLDETLWEQPVPALAGHVEPGEAVRLRIVRVNPRAGLLVLGSCGREPPPRGIMTPGRM